MATFQDNKLHKIQLVKSTILDLNQRGTEVQTGKNGIIIEHFSLSIVNLLLIIASAIMIVLGAMEISDLEKRTKVSKAE